MSTVSSEQPAVIWLRPERGARGPRPTHTRRDIARAAVAIADADGLDAVSMRRIAGRIGAGTMSLYNYVPGKHQLYDLMIDEVAGELALPAPTDDWRADLRATVRSQYRTAKRHPWLSAALRRLPSLGPNGLRYLDFALSILERAGVTPAAGMEIVPLLNGFAYTYAETAGAGTDGGDFIERWRADQASYLAGVLASGDYPHLARAMSTPAEPTDADEVFDRTLDRLIDGLVRP